MGVSTPHGGLATAQQTEKETSPQDVSTPHGGLATHNCIPEQGFLCAVSTPHGGLATLRELQEAKVQETRFNSTRWISNDSQIAKQITDHR